MPSASCKRDKPVKQAFGLYVDLGGNPIGSGTIAGVVFPFSVKLKVADAGLYPLSARETGACEASDRLLDSNWKKGKEKAPEWPEILSLSEAGAVLDAMTHPELSKAMAGASGSDARAHARRIRVPATTDRAATRKAGRSRPRHRQQALPHRSLSPGRPLASGQSARA